MEAAHLISLAEAAAQYPLSAGQLRLLARRGDLEAVKVGRNWCTTPEAVAAYLANNDLRSRNPRKNRPP